MPQALLVFPKEQSLSSHILHFPKSIFTHPKMLKIEKSGMLRYPVLDVQLFQPLANSPWKHYPTLVIPTSSGFPAALPSLTTAYAAFGQESRMKFANATNPHRKSGA